MKFEEYRHLSHALRALDSSLSQLNIQINATLTTIRMTSKMLDKEVINCDEKD